MPRPRWREFVAEYPPRQADDGTVDPRDQHVGVDTDEFFPALIRRSVFDPQLDDEDWRVLLGDSEAERVRREKAGKPVEDGKLTDRQFDQLADAAWGLNRRDVDVPFSPAASAILNSAHE
jgi:hypothetical protein